MHQITTLTNIRYGEDPAHSLDCFIPHAHCERPLVICLHSGWWHQGSKLDLRLFAMRLAELGHPCAVPNHRFLDHAAVTDGQDLVDDIKKATAIALEEQSLHGGDGRSCFLLGSGAGALLGLIVSQHFMRDCHHRILGVITCGTTATCQAWDGCPSTISKQLSAFAGNHSQLLDPMVLPAAEFPPSLLLHGDKDEEVPVVSVRAFYRRLIDQEEPTQFAVLSGVGHRFIENPNSRGAHSALDKIHDWLLQDHGVPTVSV